MTAEERTLIRQARDAHTRTRQLGGTAGRPGAETPKRWSFKWGHCCYCGVTRIRGVACQKHKPLLALDVGTAHG